MRRQTFDSRTMAVTVVAMLGVCQVTVAQEEPPPSALINQRKAETLEAARAASLRDSEETFAYFEQDVDAALARAVERVWDPERTPEPSPRTPWGDPDLRGSWISATYTPLERPARAGRQAAVHDSRGDRGIPAGRADRCVCRPGDGPLRLDRVWHGQLAEPDPTDAAHIADHRSARR